MSYSYRYIPSILSAGAQKGNDPKEQYIDLFQETLNEQFYNSSNWWTIQEETAVGSQLYESIDVRIAHLINSETGLKLGDDWKTLMFQDVNHNIELGKHYIFDDNTWLTTNTEYIKNLTGTCTIRRCNNTLRWIDEPTGAYYEEPCAIEYMVKEPRDYFTQGSPFTTPGGFLHIEMQFNERTNLINENQRFLFGNREHWTCYKVIGTGLNDFRNQKTYDMNSAKILTVDMIANFINPELDDVVNGIADANTNLYTVSLDKTTASGSPTNTILLTPSVTYNGRSVTRPMEWESSNTTVATVSASGLVTLVSTGSSLISTNVRYNSASATCIVTCSASPSDNPVILISPDKNYVLEGATGSYSAYLYIGGVQQSASMVITCNGSNVPTTSYTFTQSGSNAFSVKNNLRDIYSYLTITCATGSYSDTYQIFLKGGW